MNRRTFLQSSGAAAMMPLVPGLGDVPAGPGLAQQALSGVAGRLPVRNPFTLGVASGDPSPDGVVLWTRLAPDPLAEDGRGGMVARDVEVGWQLAGDRQFRRVVRAGTVTATADEAHGVHVELEGLEPGRDYWYRFRAGSHLSSVGRTRTTPGPESRSPLEFVTTSCAHWEEGWFTAYKHIAESTPDLVFNLGDYLYEYQEGFKPISKGDVRAHTGGRLRTLADYRRRHAQYKTDPARTVLGARQEAWLADQMRQSTAVWNLLAQQIMFAAKPRSVNEDGAVLPYEAVTVDSWDGYPGARDRLLAAVQDAALRNFVVLTGDVHSHWAADIHRDFGAAGLPPMGVELVTSSISTGGDGHPQPPWVRDSLRRHPYLRYWDGRRGWIRCRLDASSLRADFHVVPRVSQPWSPGPVAASFQLDDGQEGLRRV